MDERSHSTIPCRFCGAPASRLDRYRCPFPEDMAIFSDAMGVYRCPTEAIAFAHPVPSAEALDAYYQTIYRDRARVCAEDPHDAYATMTETPLAESQAMYLAQFIAPGTMATIVDMGCGHGVLLRRLRVEHPGARLVGVEIDPAVRPHLDAIGAEHLCTSAGASVAAIVERLRDHTLLVSSHALHYQRDIQFLREIIVAVRERGVRDVVLFIEVPNDAFDDAAFAAQRVYDVPKLTFFTADAFRRGLFDVHLVHVTTCGWTLDRELAYRRERVAISLEMRRAVGMRMVRRIVKAVIPPRARRVLRAVFSGAHAGDEAMPYFSYGGDRRAIRVYARIA